MHYRLLISRAGCVLGAALAVSLATGCSSQKIVVSPTDTTVDGGPGYTTTRVAQGQMLTVKLPTAVGTEYAWRLAPESHNSSFIRFTDRRVKVNSENTIAFGDDETMDVFTFKASRPGVQTLEFIYDCQPGTPQSRSMRMTLDVEVFNARQEALAKAKAQEEIAKQREMMAQQSATDIESTSSDIVMSESNESIDSSPTIEVVTVENPEVAPE